MNRIILSLLFFCCWLYPKAQFYTFKKINKYFADDQKYNSRTILINYKDTLYNTFTSNIFERGKKSNSYLTLLSNLSDVSKKGDYVRNKLDTSDIKFIVNKWDDLLERNGESFYLKNMYNPYIPEISFLLNINNSTFLESPETYGRLKVESSKNIFSFQKAINNDTITKFPIFIKELNNVLYSTDFRDSKTSTMLIEDNRNWSILVEKGNYKKNSCYDSISFELGENRMFKTKFYKGSFLSKIVLSKIDSQLSEITWKGDIIANQNNTVKQIRKNVFKLIELESFYFTLSTDIKQLINQDYILKCK